MGLFEIEFKVLQHTYRVALLLCGVPRILRCVYTYQPLINECIVFVTTGELVRAAVHQLHQREAAAILQPPHVCARARRVQEGGNQVGVH